MAYPVKSALALLAAVEPLDIYWLEEPLAADDYRGYRRLSDRAPIRIATGEADSGIAAYRRWWSAATWTCSSRIWRAAAGSPSAGRSPTWPGRPASRWCRTASRRGVGGGIAALHRGARSAHAVGVLGGRLTPGGRAAHRPVPAHRGQARDSDRTGFGIELNDELLQRLRTTASLLLTDACGDRPHQVALETRYTPITGRVAMQRPAISAVGPGRSAPAAAGRRPSAAWCWSRSG